ncbi:MAG: HAD family hydrolase [Peptococcaceae bacterium BRH_c8a]|nr:MAG: HAD family hydrolase [Peptococcaceae bacterium BRH_c8a]
MLRSILYPNMYVPSVTEINPDELKARGIRNLLLDLDNTIVRRDRDKFPPEVEKWLRGLRDRGINLCIVSNNGTGRVNNLAGPLQIPCVVRAVKPLRRAFRLGMQRLNAGAGDTAVVGDQIFTDILGGNMMGLFTILVVPMPGTEFWGTWLINRRLEKLVLHRVSRLVSHKDKQYHVR